MLLIGMFHFVLLGLLATLLYDNYCDDSVDRHVKAVRCQVMCATMLFIIPSAYFTIFS